MSLFPRRKIIYGCEERGDAESAYLSRWILFRSKYITLMLHKFHRSDGDIFHDHPWSFISILLFRGYNEETPNGTSRKYPGMILFRPATWAHRVVLIDGKPAWSLVVHLRRKREWGFFTSKGWQQWVSYFQERGC